MGRTARRIDVTECRQCLTYCDRVIEPASCVRQQCPSLYFYDDPLSDTRYMGCAHKVFATEIDGALFEQAERGRGYGVLKLAREPTARCKFDIERAHERPRGEEFHCVNKGWPPFPEGPPDGLRAFDLRDGLSGA